MRETTTNEQANLVGKIRTNEQDKQKHEINGNKQDNRASKVQRTCGK